MELALRAAPIVAGRPATKETAAVARSTVTRRRPWDPLARDSTGPSTPPFARSQRGHRTAAGELLADAFARVAGPPAARAGQASRVTDLPEGFSDHLDETRSQQEQPIRAIEARGGERPSRSRERAAALWARVNLGAFFGAQPDTRRSWRLAFAFEHLEIAAYEQSCAWPGEPAMTRPPGSPSARGARAGGRARRFAHGSNRRRSGAECPGRVCVGVLLAERGRGLAHALSAHRSAPIVLESDCGKFSPEPTRERVPGVTFVGDYAEWHLGLTTEPRTRPRRVSRLYMAISVASTEWAVACLYRAAEWRHRTSSDRGARTASAARQHKRLRL